MKYLFVMLAIFHAAMVHSDAAWLYNDKEAGIAYKTDPAAGGSTLEAALAEMEKAGKIDALKGLGVFELFHDNNFQNEIFAILRKDSPKELKEALASSGNMHNPKIYQVQEPFKRAVLKTPTVAAMNAALAKYGYKVTKVDFEKLGLRKEDKPRNFSGIFWIMVGKEK